MCSNSRKDPVQVRRHYEYRLVKCLFHSLLYLCKKKKMFNNRYLIKRAISTFKQKKNPIYTGDFSINVLHLAEAPIFYLPIDFLYKRIS